MPANSVFDPGQVMIVSVEGLQEAQRALGQVGSSAETGSGDMRDLLVRSARLVHAYLLGLKQDRPPVGRQGVLPVITGRLASSLFYEAEWREGGWVGVVASNVDYAAPVEDRRGFMRRAEKETTRPVNTLFTDEFEGLT